MPALWLGGILLMSTGCESEQCDVDMTLGGALEWLWTWDASTTDCRVIADPTLGMNVSFEHGGQTLEFLVANAVFQPGTYPLTTLSYADAGRVWQLDDSTTNCLVDIQEYELVDWVRDDHHRFRGTLLCSGPLREVLDDSELTLSDVTFSVYAGSDY